MKARRCHPGGSKGRLAKVGKPVTCALIAEEESMPSSGRELVSWTEERWKAIQEAVDKALAGTAKCRQVIPRGVDRIGEKAVVVAAIGPGAPVVYGPDTIATPVHVYVDATLD